MKRLGYARFVAQGGDWGSPITNEMGKAAPPELLGIHVNLPGVVPPEIIKALQAGDPAPRILPPMKSTPSISSSCSLPCARYADHGTRPQTCPGWQIRPLVLRWLLDMATAMPAGGGDHSAVAGTYGQWPLAATSHATDVPRQHHALLADQYRDSSARLYWENNDQLYLPARLRPAANHRLPRESFSARGAGGARLSQSYLLPPGDKGVTSPHGSTATVLENSGGLQAAAQIGLKDWGARIAAADLKRSTLRSLDGAKAKSGLVRSRVTLALTRLHPSLPRITPPPTHHGFQHFGEARWRWRWCRARADQHQGLVRATVRGPAHRPGAGAALEFDVERVGR